MNPEPAGTAQDDFYERLMSQIPEMLDALKTLEGERAQMMNAHAQEREELAKRHRGQVDELEERRKKISRLLRALGEEEPKPVRATATRGRPRETDPKPVGTRVLNTLLPEILKYGDDKRFTALDIHEQAGNAFSEPTTYSAFAYLRSREVIGKAGKEEGLRGRELWRILPGGREIAQQLLEGVDTNGRGAGAYHPKPTPERLTRILDAIRSLNKPAFSILEVNEVLGKASPKGTYVTFRWLKDAGVVQELEQRMPDEHGRRNRSVYRLLTEASADEILKETANA